MIVYHLVKVLDPVTKMDSQERFQLIAVNSICGKAYIKKTFQSNATIFKTKKYQKWCAWLYRCDARKSCLLSNGFWWWLLLVITWKWIKDFGSELELILTETHLKFYEIHVQKRYFVSFFRLKMHNHEYLSTNTEWPIQNAGKMTIGKTHPHLDEPSEFRIPKWVINRALVRKSSCCWF